jgi:hypothetical protein
LRAFGETRPRLMRYMRKDNSLEHCSSDAHLPKDSGGEPLTPEDIAEIIVFAATRRENVVFADSLVFPSHQVCPSARDRVPSLSLFKAYSIICYCNSLYGGFLVALLIVVAGFFYLDTQVDNVIGRAKLAAYFVCMCGCVRYKLQQCVGAQHAVLFNVGNS